MATLRLRFARAITLGCNIGSYIAKPAKKQLLPKIQPYIPPECVLQRACRQGWRLVGPWCGRLRHVRLRPSVQGSKAQLIERLDKSQTCVPCLPFDRSALGGRYHKWAPVIIDYLCKSFGISLAWILVRVINSFNAAARGAHMFVAGVDGYAKKHGMMWLSEGQMDDIFAWSLAALGVYFQLSSFFYLPWYLAIPLFPLTVVESVLTNMVGTYTE